MPWLEPIRLSGAHVRLEPLAITHLDGLIEAVRDGELWRLWYTSIPAPDAMEQEIARRLALQMQGSMLPFTVFDANGECVGMTTYMHIDAVHQRIEIGSTWLRQRAQRTPLNTDCKFLLLQHAFETLNCIAVEFRTAFFNHQSRRAIERLGAKLDGVLRSHQRYANATLRDTCVYSIIASEWPAVSAHLRHRLE